MTECVFCSIVAGSTRSWVVHEDEGSVAFLDIGQATRGHTLVVPRTHTRDVWTISEAQAADMMRSAHRVARLLKERLGPLGINIMHSSGRAAWQEVFHFHLHVVPRYGADQLVPPWRSTSPSGETLTAIYRSIVAP